MDSGIPVEPAAVTDTSEDICEVQHSIWSCAGCENVTFEYEMLFRDTEGDGGWKSHHSRHFSALSRTQAKDFRMLGPELSRLYGELLTCSDHDCLLLCTIALRGLIEGVCRDKGVTGRDLKDRISGLIRFLPSPNLIEALHGLRLAGNDAVHEFQAFTRDEVDSAIEVMEDLLNFLYDLDYKASQIRKSSKISTPDPTSHAFGGETGGSLSDFDVERPK